MNKKQYEAAFMDACMRNGEAFELLWLSGAALEHDTDEITDYAARCVIACMYIQDHSGFLMRRAAKKIRKKVETAMVEVQLSRGLAIKVKNLFEDEGYTAALQPAL
ncbi:MAG: hypothetical protein KAH11_08410 [Rhodospirillales bacterium]|nr:hypothetical protein [Rhodospirillales bacterium]